MRVTKPRSTPDPTLVEAFKQDWDARSRIFDTSPIMAYLDRHAASHTPDDATVMGVADVRVTLGDLKAFVQALK